MLLLAARLLQDAARRRDNDRVGGDHERRVGDRGQRVLQRVRVDVEALLDGRLQHVLEGREVLGEVLGLGRGPDLEVREADLWVSVLV